MYNTSYHQNINISQYSFLITGGAGFIGSNIVEYLLKHGAGKVRILDNFSTGQRKNIEAFYSNSAFELIEGDIRNYETCCNAVDGIDYISHQAALGSVPRSVNDPVTTNDVNISGFLNILVASKNSGQLKRFIYAASSSTYGDSATLPKVEEYIGNPLSPYAVTKYVNELYAQAFSRVYNFHTIGMRYFNVFGPKQNPQGPYAAVIPLFIKAAIQKQAPVMFGDGETSRDFTFVENVIQANIRAMFILGLKTSEVVNIAFGERTSLNALWKEICKLTNITIEPEYKAERKGDVKHSLANINKAKQLIQFTPETSLSEGLKKTIKWNTEFNGKIY